MSKTRHLIVRCAVPAAFALLAIPLSRQEQQTGRVFVTTVSGAIGVATERQLARAIELAQKEGGGVLIMRLDTPGGLVSSTREIIKQMIASPIPIVVYVAPSGARAASAGTFIMYASHVAAMAPGTNLGAATPIQIGGVPGVPGQPPSQPEEEKQPQAQGAADRKAINDAVALLRSLAQLRGRDPAFADRAVLEAATLTASEALGERVIEIVAPSLEDLLEQLHGRTVKIGITERVLSTRGVQSVEVEIDWRTRLLAIISDPNIAFILLMIGFYGIIMEFWNPGSMIAGVLGGISIILALIGLAALPVHFGALALLLLGLGLMIGEAFTPGIGILGIGGLGAFLAGAIFLFEGADADIRIRVSLPVILGAAATTAGMIFGVVGAAIQSRKRPSITGGRELAGAHGVVLEWSGTTGRVLVQGVPWNARSVRELEPNTAVRVIDRDGLTLIVES